LVKTINNIIEIASSQFLVLGFFEKKENIIIANIKNTGVIRKNNILEKMKNIS